MTNSARGLNRNYTYPGSCRFYLLPPLLYVCVSIRIVVEVSFTRGHGASLFVIVKFIGEFNISPTQ